MATAAISKMKDRVSAAHRSMASLRARVKHDQVRHSVMAAGAAYLIGAIEKKGTTALPTVFGLDPKLPLSLLCWAVGANSSGQTGQMFLAAADGLFTAYAYRTGLGKGYTIAGEQGQGDDDFGF